MTEAEDYWASLERSVVSEGDALRLAKQNNPVGSALGVAAAFLAGIESPSLGPEVVVTPESLDRWGDFSEASAFYNSLDRPGLGSSIDRAVGAPDVAYAKILEHVGQPFIVSVPQIVTVAAVISMVWRPELGGWRVHAFGDYLRVEDMPRTSPGKAPEN